MDVCYKTSGEIPRGYIMMKIEDMQENESLCRAQLGDWDIVALQDGTVDGGGYGYGYHIDDSRRCEFINEKLLMRDDGRPEEEKYLNCPGDDEIESDDDFESFEDWLACYWETYEECGARHSEHYDCYVYDDGCDDPNWYDCFWYGTNCDGEEQSEYEKGFDSGYYDGYADAVRDTNGPEPEEMDTFKL